MIRYMFLSPQQFIPTNLIEKIPAIIDYEYKLQLQVYDEQSITEKEPDILNSEEWNSYRIGHNIYYYIAINDDNDIVGCISFFNNIKNLKLQYYPTYPINSLHISQFYVNENYRTRGIGSTLLDKVEEFGKIHNYKYLDLNTSYSNNISQILYKSKNYERKFLSVKLLEYDKTLNNRSLLMIQNISDKLDSYIHNSLSSLISYQDNGYGFNDLYSNIIDNLSKGYFIVFKHFDTIYSICTIEEYMNKKCLKILDIVGFIKNDIIEEYDHIIKDLISYNNSKNLNGLSFIIKFNDYDLFVNKFNFKPKMFSMYKKL